MLQESFLETQTEGGSGRGDFNTDLETPVNVIDYFDFCLIEQLH